MKVNSKQVYQQMGNQNHGMIDRCPAYRFLLSFRQELQIGRFGSERGRGTQQGAPQAGQIWFDKETVQEETAQRKDWYELKYLDQLNKKYELHKTMLIVMPRIHLCTLLS